MAMTKKGTGILIASLLCMLLAFLAAGQPQDQLFYQLVSIVPLILILVLLFLQVDMLVAAFVGGVASMILGGIGIATANSVMMKEIPAMLGVTVPIINSAIATAVFKAGGYSAALALVRRAIGGRTEFLGAFVVILQAAATYMSGIGGASAMVIAPLAFAAVGVAPGVIAGMAIAAAVSFTTSPASLETSVIANQTGIDAGLYVSTMQPFWITFCVIAVLIAFFDVKRRKGMFQGEEDAEMQKLTTGQLWKLTMPAIFLLFAVIAGPAVNEAVGSPVLGPMMYSIITIALIYVCSRFTLNQSAEAMIDGSTYILTRLFAVGIFVAFVRIIEMTGAFGTIAAVVQAAPSVAYVPVAVLVGYLIGVPAGAFVGSILALILPVTVTLGFTPMQIGMVVMGVGLGSQMSPVNITMQALSAGFRIPVLQVVKGNAPYVLSCLALLIIAAFIL
ncbi:MAG: UIT9 transporter [Candidatus Tokpelaia hoelldobleri]|uniref:UIT9 transporter n=1 Tax=Candidatus Tokpelaia hoelldobleri TaxID=1902579 RepID=A0A1U9JV53_9HYPH|nr:MAG: UIT9 transporter [Candidatus Tokpelaia hoelldoblerii]